jgi:hypothetical protein
LVSWGAKGHRAVATIAEKHLSTNTAKIVAFYLKGESITDASFWADEVRDLPRQISAAFHYVLLHSPSNTSI